HCDLTLNQDLTRFPEFARRWESVWSLNQTFNNGATFRRCALRVTVGTPEENRRFLDELARILRG
ncbi:hypothetical protein, partial [Methylomagnum sp.]